MSSLKILLAEDVAMVRGALVALIELEPDMKVVAAIERGDDIVSQAYGAPPWTSRSSISTCLASTGPAPRPGCTPSCCVLPDRDTDPNLGRAGNLRRAPGRACVRLHAQGCLCPSSSPGRSAMWSAAGGSSTLIWPCPPGTAATIRCPRGSTKCSGAPRAAPTPSRSRLSCTCRWGRCGNYLTVAIVTKMSARNRVDAVRVAREAGWLP